MNKLKLLSNPSHHQADVWLVEENGLRMVYKDFRKKGFIGRFIVNREASFYRRLRGIKGVPEYYGSLSSGSLLIEYIEGESIKKYKNLSSVFFEKLSRLMDEIHSRGVLYFDLRHMSNLLVGRGEEPFLVDYGTCLYSPLLVKALKFVDDGAELYIKQRVSPELLSAPETMRVKKMNRLSGIWFFNKLAGGD